MAVSNQYIVDIVLKAKEENMAAFAQVGAGMALMVAEAKLANEELKRLNETATEHGNALHNMSADTLRAAENTARMADSLEKQLTPAVQNATQAASNNRNAFAALLAALGPVGTTIAALVVTAAPLIPLLLGVVVVLGAFALGLAATLSVMALSAAAVLGLAAGVIALAAATQHWTGVTQTVPQAQQAVANATLTHQQAVLALHQAQTTYNATSTHTAAQTLALQQAQQKAADSAAALTKAQQDLTAAQTGANNPLQKLRDDAGKMADALGKQAAPMAALLLGWLDKLIPQVQELGSQLLSWFGARLPGVLKGASDVVDQLFGALQGLGEVLGRFLDQAGARAPQFTALFGQMLGVGIDAIDGLLTNLLRLSDWFLQRLPAMAPIASEIFDKIGLAIQWIGRWAGVVVDWFLQHWPEITSTAQSVYGQVGEGLRILQPVLENFKKTWQELAPWFQYIRDHAENLKPVLVGLGLVLAGIVVVLAAVGVGIVLLVAGIVWLAGKVQEAVKQWIQAGQDIGDTMSKVGVLARQYQSDIGAVFSAVGTFLHTAVTQYQQAATDIGKAFSDMGTFARTMQTDVQKVFDAVGTAAQGMVDGVGKSFSGLGDKVHSGLQDAGGVFDKFGGLVNGALGVFGVHISTIGKFASGGVVPGSGPADSVLAMVSPGEGILTPQTVRQLGGAAAIDSLNQGALDGAHGLGALVASDTGALASMVGSIAGQCVVAVEKWTGHYFPVAMASQMTRWINSAVAAVGSIFVSTLPPFGHTGIVLPAGKVIDSNWGLDERVRVHNLSDIPDIAGYITGMPANLGSLAGLAGLAMPDLGSLVSTALHGLGGWQGTLAKGILDQAVTGIKHNLGFDSGGYLPTGTSIVSNHTGQPEPVLGPGSQDDIAAIRALMAAAVEHLARLSGAPRLSAATAAMRY